MQPQKGVEFEPTVALVCTHVINFVISVHVKTCLFSSLAIDSRALQLQTIQNFVILLTYINIRPVNFSSLFESSSQIWCEIRIVDLMGAEQKESGVHCQFTGTESTA